MPSAPQPDPAPKSFGFPEVRYSLPELLRDIEVEREAPAFAMEQLDQSDITRVFKKRARRVLKSRK